jgi:hypothetical protein
LMKCGFDIESVHELLGVAGPGQTHGVVQFIKAH